MVISCSGYSAAALLTRAAQGGIETDTADQLHDRGVRCHESLVEGSGNFLFIDTMRLVSRVRRLLSYRSMRDRSRYQGHCEQHLLLLDLWSTSATRRPPPRRAYTSAARCATWPAPSRAKP